MHTTSVPAEMPRPQKQLSMFQFRTKIVWFNAIGFLILHLAALYGVGLALVKMYHLQFATIIWSGAIGWLGGEGILMGAHRMWTHKSFKANLPLQIVLLIMQTLAGQNCIWIWVRDHRQHHKYTDTDADPHNANRGFFFSHMGWLMMKKHPDVIKMGKTINMTDLDNDPLVMFQKKWYTPMYIVIAFLLPSLIPIYCWNEDPWFAFIVGYFSRYLLLLNLAWCVNSVAHMFGTRPYDSTIMPVESTFVSIIAFGEGWHNYHHAFPWDYKAAEFGKGLNFTRTLIEWSAKMGWAYDLREASQSVVNKKAKRLGDGTHIPAPCPEFHKKVHPSFYDVRDNEVNKTRTPA